MTATSRKPVDLGNETDSSMGDHLETDGREQNYIYWDMGRNIPKGEERMPTHVESKQCLRNYLDKKGHYPCARAVRKWAIALRIALAKH